MFIHGKRQVLDDSKNMNGLKKGNHAAGFVNLMIIRCESTGSAETISSVFSGLSKRPFAQNHRGDMICAL